MLSASILVAKKQNGHPRKPNLKRYIASVGWSDTCVYAGGSSECSYGGRTSSADRDRRISSCRLSRVPVRLVLRARRELEEGETPKKSSIASVLVSSIDVRTARGALVRAGEGGASCASMSMSCAGVAGRSNKPKKEGREVEEDATGEDMVFVIVVRGRGGCVSRR